MIRLRRIGAVGLLVLLAGCGAGDEGPPPPVAGDLLVTYFQGGPQAGAMLFTITGGTVASVTALSGVSLTVTSSTPMPGTTRVIVLGTLQTGDILTVRVPDVSLASGYVARVNQVADDLTFSLIDPSQHTLTIHR